MESHENVTCVASLCNPQMILEYLQLGSRNFHLVSQTVILEIAQDLNYVRVGDGVAIRGPLCTRVNEPAKVLVFECSKLEHDLRYG